MTDSRSLFSRRKRYVYVDKNGQVRARYVRILTVGRFELALTWIERG